MAHNPQAPQSPEGHDPAGSTQMFRAFVDDGGPQHGGRGAAAPAPAGPRVGLIVGIAAAVAILGTVVWLALG